MDDSLYFSEQHLAVRNMVREFARSEVAPVAAELDAKAEFPWGNVKKMGELGLLGIPWPEDLGGAGLDLLSYMIVINEMAKVDASHAITISAHTTLGTSPIVNFGTGEQKKRYVPLLASGKVLGGSDSPSRAPAATREHASTAVRKGAHYVLNGSKIFITHGGVGEVFVVTAVTEPGAGTKGISSFIVTKETSDLDKVEKLGIGHDDSIRGMPGFRSGKKEDKLGWRASDTRSLIFEDVEVPAENMLGEEGEAQQFHADARLGSRGNRGPLTPESPKARSSNRFDTRRCANSSASRSQTFRESSFSSPTSRPRSRQQST